MLFGDLNDTASAQGSEALLASLLSCSKVSTQIARQGFELTFKQMLVVRVVLSNSICIRVPSIACQAVPQALLVPSFEWCCGIVMLGKDVRKDAKGIKPPAKQRMSHSLCAKVLSSLKSLCAYVQKYLSIFTYIALHINTYYVVLECSTLYYNTTYITLHFIELHYITLH